MTGYRWYGIIDASPPKVADRTGQHMRHRRYQASTYYRVGVDMHCRVYVSTQYGRLGLSAACSNVHGESNQLPKKMALLLDMASPPLRAHSHPPYTRGVTCPQPAEIKSFVVEVLDRRYILILRWHEHVELHCRDAQTARLSNRIGCHHEDICSMGSFYQKGRCRQNEAKRTNIEEHKKRKENKNTALPKPRSILDTTDLSSVKGQKEGVLRAADRKIQLVRSHPSAVTI